MTSSPASASSKSGPRAAGAGALLGKSVRMILAGHRQGERPPVSLPTLVVLGRSNVGKSSLLNALLKVKVAKVSQTPGRTQALYWYRVDDRFDLVDCPGYGYAKTAKENRALFSEMIEALLVGEPKPSALLLVDSRLEPQESDRSMALFLAEAGIRTVVAATKWDAVKPSQRVRRLRDLGKEYQLSDRPLQPVSSETGENLAGLGRLLRERLDLPDPGAPRRRAPASTSLASIPPDHPGSSEPPGSPPSKES